MILEFHSPIHTCGKLMFNSKINDEDISISTEGILTNVVYFGAIAAFSGKVFTHLNPWLAATYGCARGATELYTSHFLYKNLIGDKETRDKTKYLMRGTFIFLDVALTGILAWGFFRGIQEIATRSIPILNKLSKQNFSYPRPITFIEIAVMEAGLVGMSLLRVYLTKHPSI